MNKARVALISAMAAGASAAAPISFEADTIGSAPAGWICGMTGSGQPKWTVERDASTTPPFNVLLQSGAATFPWCVRDGLSIADGFVEVRFKPMRGREDQAGGLVWRWKSGEQYYVARANALENNVSLYYTEGGRRKTLKYVDAPVPANAWHTLRVEFNATRIKVILDGKLAIEQDDTHITGAGTAGVWTKADSVTAFAGFSYGVSGRP